MGFNLCSWPPVPSPVSATLESPMDLKISRSFKCYLNLAIPSPSEIFCVRDFSSGVRLLGILKDYLK